MSDESESQFTPELSRLIRLAMERRLADVHTAMPASIVSYDFSTNLAKVKPEFKRKFASEPSARPIPIISNVPVMQFRLGNAHIRLPVAKGNTGMLIFAERSIDRWMEGAGDHDPVLEQKHDLSDAVFFPGLFPTGQKMLSGSANDSLEVRNNTAFIDLKRSGKIRLGNNEEELISLLSDVLDTLSSLSVQVNGVDTGPGSVVASLTAGSSAQIDALNQRLAKLKG